jgi:single-strand DNA-binding protein
MVNKVILMGHAGADPAVRYLEGGVAVANFSLATSEAFKNKNGERVEQTEWHNIVLWRGLAQFAERNVRKGALLYVEGKARTRSWEDKTGVTRHVTEVHADVLQLLARGKEGNAAAAQVVPAAAPAAPAAPAPATTGGTTPETTGAPLPSPETGDAADDDLPF